MIGLGLGVFMATLDASIVNIALPTLETTFNTNFSTIQWVILSYVLVLTAAMLMAARLGDMLDKKKIYITGLALFTLGSGLCGLSPSVGWLIGFRGLQGLGATMMQALGIAMITEVFPREERGRALGIMGAVVSVGIAVGPPLGGILIGLVGWRAIFLVNLPVGILTFFMVTRFVPALKINETRQHFDWVGGLILFVSMSAYALGMTTGQQQGFRAPLTLALLAAAGVGLAVLLLVETRQKQPMIDLKLFRNTLFSINLLMGLLVFIVLAGNFILPFFLELVQGYSVQTVGLLLMTMPVLMGVIAPLSGSLSDRFGSRGISMLGLAVIVVGCVALSTLNEQVTLWGFAARMAPFGIGFGLFQSPNNSAVMGAAPRNRLGIASGLLSLSRTLGQTTGLPLMGAIFTAQVMSSGLAGPGGDVTAAPAAALIAGVNNTYRVAAYFIGAATLLAGVALWLDQRRSSQEKLETLKHRFRDF